MIETNQELTVETAKMATPTTITTSMILADLENGIDRPGIKAKYDLEGWELTEMFKHPVLKGKKASRKRKMSFTFVDDTAASLDTVSPAQVDLEKSIEEVEEYNDEQTNAMEQEIEDRNQFEAEQAEEDTAFSAGFDGEEF